MKKSGWALSAAASLVAAGVALAAGAYWTSTGVEAQSTGLPETLGFVPRTAKVVGHFNLTSFSRSPLRKKWEQALEKRGGTSGLDEFREMTGLDPFRDVVSVSFAFVPRENQPEAGPPLAPRFGVALQGHFDEKTLLDKIAENATVEPEDYRGTTIYYVSRGGEKDGEESGFAFSSRDTVLFGEATFLKEMIDTGAGRRASAGSALTAEWGDGNFAEDTFWVAASPDNGFRSMMPQGGEIPPVQSLALSGRLDKDVSLKARGKAKDAVAATKLADVVRGFIALGSLQQGGNPELAGVLESIQIHQVDNEVEVSLNVPYETLLHLSRNAEKREAEDP